jgi:PAS domain S-box-containing protein
MRLKSLLILVLMLFALIPAAFVGSYAYSKSYSGIYEVCRQDLEERMDFCLRTCDFYNKKVVKGELTEQEAISEIATLLAGPVQPGGNRNISQGLGKGKTGYVCAINDHGIYVFHPFREGQHVKEIKDLEVRKVVIITMNATNREWHEYKWKNPEDEKYYLKVRTLDYFEPFGLHFSVSATVDDFTKPLELIRKVIITAVVVATAAGIIASLLVARGITKPFVALSEISSKITRGDLTVRATTKSPIMEVRTVGKDVNEMVKNLQSTIRGLNDSISHYSRMLSEYGIKIAELDKAVERAESIMSCIPEILIVIDKDERWIRVNPAFERITGFEIEEVLDKKTVEQPVYKNLPESIELDKQMWSGVKKGEMVSGLEIPWRTKKGKKIVLSASEQGLKDAKGDVVGGVFTAKEVTKKRGGKKPKKNR